MIQRIETNDSSCLARCTLPILGITASLSFMLGGCLLAAQKSLECNSSIMQKLGPLLIPSHNVSDSSRHSLNLNAYLCNDPMSQINLFALTAISMVGAAFVLSRCCNRR